MMILRRNNRFPVLCLLISLILSLNFSKLNADTSNNFDDWEKICDEKTQICSIYTFGYDPAGERKARVSISLTQSENGKIAEMTILSPLYSYLPHGMITSIQDNEPIRHEFDLCAQEGCINFIPLMEPDVEMLKKEWNMVLILQDYRTPNEKVILDVSLVGLQKAFQALRN